MKKPFVLTMGLAVLALGGEGVAQNRGAGRAPQAQAAETVPVQIAGLRQGETRSFASVMHAIRRDAMPLFETCAAALNSPRNTLDVTLFHVTNGRWNVQTVTAQRPDPALVRCVSRAAARIAIPASELPEASAGARTAEPEAPVEAVDTVRFSVAFSMPRYGAPTARGAARR
ncbi:MAG: hypothetical protein JNK72_05525 [Myxococcales bacterium]|nr:hypothetical protein [Myxococcales bacterium]